MQPLTSQQFNFVKNITCIMIRVALILNHMVKCSPRLLNRTFAALADPTRRRILEHLAHGDRCVTDLARPYSMSLPAVSKHLRVLENAGLDPPPPPRAGAFVEIGGRADAAGAGVDRGIPAILGREF